MIVWKTGDIFSSTAEALVNPVNSVGVSGRGLALEFKKRFPVNFKIYNRACNAGKVRPGTVFIVDVANPLIINFPTKDHWRDDSCLEDIEASLYELRSQILQRQIKSVAIPRIGCGLGGLDWSDVRPKIASALADLPAHIEVFESEGVPQ